MDPEFGRLSELPSDVAEKILSLLPIKEAVRTSILSSKWRYKWAMLPDLVFNQLSFPGVYNRDELVKNIDHVLFLHIGPIRKFKLSHIPLENTTDIDRWILHHSKNSMKEFTFKSWNYPLHKMPSCLFSCQDLVHLELEFCLLKLPRTFKGFKSLKKLEIGCVTLTQDDFENLIVCCPLLEKLAMINWHGFTKVKIDAPNLRDLVVGGIFEDLSLQNTLKLDYIAVVLAAKGEQRRQILGSSCNLVKLFSQCAHVQSVAINMYFLKYLAVGDLPVSLPEPCVHLRLLHIDVNFNDLEEVSATLCLLRSALALQSLNIKARQSKQAAVLGDVNSLLDDNQTLVFTNLRLVKITCISGIEAELDFIRLLLSSSPVLESITVMPAAVPNSSKLLKKLIQFKKASVHAEVIYLEK